LSFNVLIYNIKPIRCKRNRATNLINSAQFPIHIMNSFVILTPVINVLELSYNVNLIKVLQNNSTLRAVLFFY
jgi:hypothetical protein